MTYCLGIALSEGIVFCSDSRTNAGPDRVNTYSKMHSFFFEEDRSITLLSAGNLATSQSVIAKLNRDLEGGEITTIRSGRYVSDVADYVGVRSLRFKDQKPKADQTPVKARKQILLRKNRYVRAL